MAKTTKMADDQTRRLLLLQTEKVAALRELEQFRVADRPDDLTSAAMRARLIYESEKAASDDRAMLLMAVRDAMIPFSTGVGGEIVNEVAFLVKRWGELETENERLRQKLRDQLVEGP